MTSNDNTTQKKAGELPWETEMAINSFLCVLEEACHREIDEAGPFVVYNPDGDPFAVPLGEKTMRNMFYRIRDAMRKRFGEAYEHGDKYILCTEANALAEEREALARREAFNAAIELVWKHLAVMRGSTQARDDLVMELKAQAAPEKEEPNG